MIVVSKVRNNKIIILIKNYKFIKQTVHIYEYKDIEHF